MGCFLFIDDELPDVPGARVFDPTNNGFNPLWRKNYREARRLAEIPYVASPID
jgi:hypothetical protein